MSRLSERPTDRPIQPKDKVHIDHGSRVYTVQAISRIDPEAYVTDGENTGIGTWVPIDQLTHARAEEVAR